MSSTGMGRKCGQWSWLWYVIKGLLRCIERRSIIHFLKTDSFTITFSCLNRNVLLVSKHVFDVLYVVLSTRWQPDTLQSLLLMQQITPWTALLWFIISDFLNCIHKNCEMYVKHDLTENKRMSKLAVRKHPENIQTTELLWNIFFSYQIYPQLYGMYSVALARWTKWNVV